MFLLHRPFKLTNSNICLSTLVDTNVLFFFLIAENKIIRNSHK